MNCSSSQTWSTLDRIKKFFGYRSQTYQPIAKNDMENMSSSLNIDTSCLNDSTSIEQTKSALIHHLNNINMEQIQEILPLVDERAFHLNKIHPPVSSYTNDTRPDADLLEC
ncbi:unnamed protein product [Adineta ricciae]|uniref:Uncharacterized protein n=1 Tax=Adineta ricciae TaxID=249248 RepID=A0A814U996_ADIRI|nr:unnamed protein product [Adineta ricciae]